MIELNEAMPRKYYRKKDFNFQREQNLCDLRQIGTEDMSHRRTILVRGRISKYPADSKRAFLSNMLCNLATTYTEIDSGYISCRESY
jgi:hypothetical protein